MKSVDDLQKLLGLLSRVSPSYREILIDLFPADLVEYMQEKHGNPVAEGDDIHLWFSEIYHKNFPSLEEQRQRVDDDERQRAIWQQEEEEERQRLLAKQEAKRKKRG